jgi:hypothetical protein
VGGFVSGHHRWGGICRLSAPGASISGYGSLGAWLRVAAVVTGLGMVGSGVQWIRAETAGTALYWFHKEDQPVIALQYANLAASLYPLNYRYRAQLPLSLHAVMNAKNVELKISDAAVDRVHRLGMSASPFHPATLAMRAEWLINSGQIGPELAEIIAYLKTHATRQPEAVVIVRYYEALP